MQAEVTVLCPGCRYRDTRPADQFVLLLNVVDWRTEVSYVCDGCSQPQIHPLKDSDELEDQLIDVGVPLQYKETY